MKFPCRLCGGLLLALTACGRREDVLMRLPTERPGATPPPDGAPVALNAESPVTYPPALLTQRIEGTVVLRLFVNEKGVLLPESTRIAESSGYPAFDSAAVAAVPQLHFAPAVREGTPVATTFLQPVHFRRHGVR